MFGNFISGLTEGLKGGVKGLISGGQSLTENIQNFGNDAFHFIGGIGRELGNDQSATRRFIGDMLSSDSVLTGGIGGPTLRDKQRKANADARQAVVDQKRRVENKRIQSIINRLEAEATQSRGAIGSGRSLISNMTNNSSVGGTLLTSRR